MEEAEMVCDRVAVISKGQILAIGEPHILISELIGSQVVELNVNRGICIKVKGLGVPDNFVEQGSIPELMQECGYDANGIYNTIIDVAREI